MNSFFYLSFAFVCITSLVNLCESNSGAGGHIGIPNTGAGAHFGNSHSGAAAHFGNFGGHIGPLGGGHFGSFGGGSHKLGSFSGHLDGLGDLLGGLDSFISSLGDLLPSATIRIPSKIPDLINTLAPARINIRTRGLLHKPEVDLIIRDPSHILANLQSLIPSKSAPPLPLLIAQHPQQGWW